MDYQPWMENSGKDHYWVRVQYKERSLMMEVTWEGPNDALGMSGVLNQGQGLQRQRLGGRPHPLEEFT